jgi:hypothetical protein
MCLKFPLNILKFLLTLFLQDIEKDQAALDAMGSPENSET